ncbi:hypothetical protein HDU93_001359 [Gonapodya sp. JEL0774]|nr:hypothetical protein HDU93_001359 [Gonapodya sp. JEL0774]
MSPRPGSSSKRGKADDDDDFSSGSPNRKRPKVKLLKDLGSGDEKPKSSRKRAPQNRVCEYCGATETPIWRRGPHGKGTLCNRCGVKWMTGKIVLDEEGNLKYIGGAPQYAQRKQTRVMNRNGTGKKKSDGGASSADDIARPKPVGQLVRPPPGPLRPLPPIRAGHPSSYMSEAAELLSYERKKLLSDAIGHLSDDHIDEVVEIIKMRVPDLPTSQQPDDEDEEEIELDMDTIDQATLQLLYTYVEKIGIIKDGRLVGGDSETPMNVVTPMNSLLGPEFAFNGSQDPSFAPHGSIVPTFGVQTTRPTPRNLPPYPPPLGAARSAIGAGANGIPSGFVAAGVDAMGGLEGIKSRSTSDDIDTSSGREGDGSSIKDDDMTRDGDVKDEDISDREDEDSGDDAEDREGDGDEAVM